MTPLSFFFYRNNPKLLDGSISPSLALVSFSSSCDFSWKDSSSLIIQHCESICEERHLHMTAALKTAFRKNMTQPVLQFINSAFKMCSFLFLKTLNWHYVRVYSKYDEERKTAPWNDQCSRIHKMRRMSQISFYFKLQKPQKSVLSSLTE